MSQNEPRTQPNQPQPPSTLGSPAVAPTPADTSVYLQELKAYHQYKIDSMKIAHSAYRADLQAQEQTPSIVPIIGVCIPVIAILGSFLVVYRSIEAKRALKLAMIEKGVDASILAEPINENSRKFSALRYGLLLCGIGFGIIVGLVISDVLDLHGDASSFVSIATTTMFGGLGMVIYHVMAKRSDSAATTRKQLPE